MMDQVTSLYKLSDFPSFVRTCYSTPAAKLTRAQLLDLAESYHATINLLLGDISLRRNQAKC